jgi:hypothetical protein
MMTGQLETLATRLDAARWPEDVFGVDPTAALRAYRRLAAVAHPDRNPTQPDLAGQAFRRLAALWEEAQQRIATGDYGSPRPTTRLTLTTPDRSYEVVGRAFDGDLTRLFWTQDGLLVKVANNPADNDLLAAEAAALRLLRKGDARSWPSFPELLDSFRYRTDGRDRQAQALRVAPNLYSLREVLAHHGTLDPRHVAWIFRRVLVALGYAHRAGLAHGAVTPEHVLVEPRDHGLVLIDWCYSRPLGEPLQAIPTAYRAWYPAEVLNRRPVTPGLDVGMAARCMVALLGGDPIAWRTLPNLHPRLAAFFGAWRTAGSDHAHDAWALNREFTDLIDDLWPRRYWPLSMPPRV